MEKIDNKQQNKLADDDLEQVGGGKFFDVFTTEFREFFGISDNPDDTVEEKEEDSHYGVRTLEMRVDPMKRKKRNRNGPINL